MWKAAHARRNCIVDYSLLINQLLLCKRRLFKRRLKLTALLGRILLTLTKVIKTLQPTWNNNGFIFIPVNSLTKLSYRYVQFLLKEKVSSCSRGHQFFKDLRSSVSWFFVELKEREKTTEEKLSNHEKRKINFTEEALPWDIINFTLYSDK